VITSTLTGDKRLRAQFDALDRAVQGQMLKSALVAGGLLVANKAKALSPYLTGNNRRGIHVGGEGGAGGLEGGTTGTDIGGQEFTETSAQILVGTNVEYARRLELGFAGADSLGRMFNQPAQPYLRPALESEAPSVVNEFGDALVDLLRGAV
jgi:HK97 gp10 family phage protein